MKTFYFLICWATVFDSLGSNKFVRTSSAGANNGADWNNAWSMTSFNAAFSGLSAGDTVYFAGGTYTTQVYINKSGTAGNPITLKRATASSSVCTSSPGWSSGFDTQVLVRPTGSGTAAIGCLWEQDGIGSYVTIDGVVTDGFKFHLNQINQGVYGGGISVYYGAGNLSNIVLTNLDIAGPAPNASPFNYNGEYACGLTFWPIISGVPVKCTDITVSNCKIHGGANLVITHTIDRITFDACEFYDNAVAGSPATQPHGNMFEAHTVNGFTLKNSYLHGWQAEGVRPYGDSFNYTIYGNVFANSSNGDFTRCIESDSSVQNGWGPLIVNNNTFYQIYWGTDDFSGPVFSPTTSRAVASGSGATNNIFYRCIEGDLVINKDYNWRNGALAGTHSINGGASPTIFVNAGTSDFHILSTISSTFPRDKGFNVGSTFTPDPDGIARGADGTWDMGAFEFVSGADTTPPTLYSAKLSGNVTINGGVIIK
jgi:hypothetical protein